MKRNLTIVLIIVVSLLIFNIFFKNPVRNIVDTFNLGKGDVILNDQNLVQEQCNNCNTTHSLISADNIASGDTVANGQLIKGKAIGPWYFEASFPVRVYDDQNNEVGVSVAKALGDWMTENFVPFEVTLNFSGVQSGSNGKIRFEKDNPSGEPEFDDFYEVSVIFE